VIILDAAARIGKVGRPWQNNSSRDQRFTDRTKIGRHIGRILDAGVEISRKTKGLADWKIGR